MLRTQIYLPEQLRQDIDRITKDSNQSLAEYARNAIAKQVKADKKKKVDFKKLALEVIGSSNRSEEEVQEWLDWIQTEKKLVDEKIDEKWAKARKK